MQVTLLCGWGPAAARYDEASSRLYTALLNLWATLILSYL